MFTKKLTENKEENREIPKVGIDFPRFQSDKSKKTGITETKKTKKSSSPPIKCNEDVFLKEQFLQPDFLEIFLPLDSFCNSALIECPNEFYTFADALINTIIELNEVCKKECAPEKLKKIITNLYVNNVSNFLEPILYETLKSHSFIGNQSNHKREMLFLLLMNQLEPNVGEICSRVISLLNRNVKVSRVTEILELAQKKLGDNCKELRKLEEFLLTKCSVINGKTQKSSIAISLNQTIYNDKQVEIKNNPINQNTSGLT